MSQRSAHDRRSARSVRRVPPVPRRAAAVVVGLAAALLVGCAAPDDAASPAAGGAPDLATTPAPAPQDGADRPLVVVTTSILGDVVGALAGEDVTVEVLIGPGADPHDVALSAAQTARVADAALVVANGLGLEATIDPVLDRAGESGVSLLRVGESVDPLTASAPHAHDDDHAHGDEGLDPHFWWDPARMALAVDALAAALAELDGVDDAALAERAAAYRTALADADAAMAETFAAVPSERRRLVTNHDALGYLAARYDLEVIGTVIPGTSTDVAADAATFAALVDAVERAGVTVVFAETTDSTALAEQLARELARRGSADAGEVRVVRILTDALGPPGSGAETYLDLLATTSRTIAEALTG